MGKLTELLERAQKMDLQVVEASSEEAKAWDSVDYEEADDADDEDDLTDSKHDTPSSQTTGKRVSVLGAICILSFAAAIAVLVRVFLHSS